MSCWLDYQSPFFHSLSLTSDKSEVVQTLIDSAIEFVEKFCNRNFLLQEHDKVFTVLQGGSVVLDNTPISYVSRICTNTGSFLTIENTTATNATYATADSSLILNQYASGVRTTTELAYADYPTLGELAEAVNDLSGWVVDVATGYTTYPSTDLIGQQHGNARVGNTLYSWDDYTGRIDLDPRQGIIDLYGYCGARVRVVYTGGFADVPEPIKQVVANLVVSAYNGPEGRVQSETIGGYSYSLASVDSLPANDKKVLAYYRDRR